jgi:hypothetical protein
MIGGPTAENDGSTAYHGLGCLRSLRTGSRRPDNGKRFDKTLELQIRGRNRPFRPYLRCGT